MKVQQVKFDISTKTILKIIFILFGLFLLSKLLDVLVMVFIAIIIAATLHEPVSWLEKKKIPKTISALLAFLALFIILSLAIYLVLPLLISEIGSLSHNFPNYTEQFKKISSSLNYWVNRYQIEDQFQSVLLKVGQYLAGLATGLFGAVVSIFGGLVSAVLVLVISFYFTVSAKEIREFLIDIAPLKKKKYISSLIGRLQKKLGKWFRGQLILSLIVGILIFIGLKILGVKYALTLALMAAIFEIIPWLGPILSGIIATALTLIQSPLLALLVAILFIIIQQLENTLLVPQVMKRTVNLNVVVIVLALLIGTRLAGVIGVVLAVPTAAILVELVKDWQERKAKREQKMI